MVECVSLNTGTAGGKKWGFRDKRDSEFVGSVTAAEKFAGTWESDVTVHLNLSLLL